MKVFAWSAGDDGCRFYRVQLPLVALRNAYGWDTYYNEEWVDKYPYAGEGWRSNDVDVVIGQRVSNPGASRLWQRLAKESDRPMMVYELDDDFFSIDQLNPAHAWFQQNREAIVGNIRASDRVTVSTNELAEVIEQYNPNVRVVPNYIGKSLVEGPVAYPQKKLTVGWAGSHTHHYDWMEIESELKRFLKRNPSVELHTIGYDYGAGMPNARHTGWQTTVPAYWRLIDFYVGLAPLRATVFNRSKSHIKALEYASLGIPCVASDVEPYRQFVQDGVTGYVLKHAHQWPSKLRDLVYDRALWVSMSKAARKRAGDWTIEGNIARWKDALTP